MNRGPLAALLLVAALASADTADELARAGRAAFGDGQHALAARSFQTLLEDYPDSSRAPEAMYLLAASLYSLDRPAEAIERLETLRRRWPSSPLGALTGYWLGASWMKLGRFDRASGFFAEQLAQPGIEGAWRQRTQLAQGVCLEQLARSEEASAAYRAVLASSGTAGSRAEAAAVVAEARYRLGSLEYRAGRWTAARDLFAKLLADAPRSAFVRDAVFLIGECELALGHLTEAEKRFRTLISLYPDSPDRETASWRLVEIAARSGRRDQALAMIEEFIDRFPKGAHRAAAYRLQGDLHYGSKRWAEAAASYGRALALAPDDAQRQAARLAIGLARIALGQEAEAVAPLAEAAAGPSPAEAERAGFELAAVLAGLGREAEAIRALDDWSTRYPSGGRREEALRLLASLLEKKGDTEAANRRWSELVRSFPRSSRADEYLYRRGASALAAGRLADALEDLQRLGRDFSKSGWRAEASYAVGWAYAQRGEHARALAFFQEAARGSTGDLALRAGVAAGVSLFNLGDYAKALAAFDGLRARARGTASEGEVALYAARALYRLERFEEAAHRFRESAGASRAQGAEARYWLGWSLFKLNRLAESRDAFLELARGFPSDPRRAEALLRAGICESLAGRDREAVTLFDECVRVADTSLREQALYERAWALSRLGDPAAAEAFERLAREFPGGRLAPEAFYKRGADALGAGRAAEALVLFRRVARQYPQHPLAEPAQAWAGNAALATGNAAAALEELWRFCSRWPRGEMLDAVLEDFRRALDAVGGTERASQLERRARQELVAPAAARVRIACASRLADADPRAALAVVEEVRSGAQDEIAAAEAALVAGRCHAALGDAARALAILEALASSRPDRIGAQARLEVARVLESSGRTAEALEEYLSVPYLFPDLAEQSAEGLFQAARVARARGERDRGRSIEDKLRREYPDSPWIEQLTGER